jgi:hypothetical protein
MKFKKEESDKVYWHKYIDFYNKILPESIDKILEIGVFKGESIAYWREKYPKSKIFGLDIVEQNSLWPKDEKIKYFQLDQSDTVAYKKVLENVGDEIDLIIEDGSHDPFHQKISLIESLNYIKKGGIYILEDVHTSHPHHSYYKSRLAKFNDQLTIFNQKKKNILMPLQCLLLLEHLKTNGLNIESVKDMYSAKNSLFSYDEIVRLYKKVKKIKFYRRNVLPNYCYSCKTNDYDFINLKCNCGVDLYLDTDSMSVVLEF